jgi:hypothetical protein
LPRRARPTTSIISLVVLATSVGCASARIRRENERALAAADSKVLAGCYDCLQDARRTYERLAVGKHASGIVVRLFETNVLLTIREKELGLDSRPSFGRARALAPRVPATVGASRVLAMADAMLSDDRAVPTKARDARIAELKSYRAALDTELTWIEQAPLTPAVRKYIALAVDCAHADRYRTPTDTAGPLQKRRLVPINAPPLVAYRAADCANTDTLTLKRVLTAAPSFDEAAYALGNVVAFSASETGGEDALRYLMQARTKFPRAPGVSFMLGWLNLNIGDCAEAVRYYDSTLTMVPTHDRAMLQKAICQSRSHQDSAAIATATQFIALDTPDVAEGYYWRAVSVLRQRELDRARSDVEIAKARTSADAGTVRTLAGIIEHEQSDFPIAEADLRSARASWKGYENCTAAFYLGSVLTKREAWPEAAASYDSAMVCYADKAAKTEGMIARVQASTKGSAAYRAKRIAALESDLEDLRKRYFTSSFNAASMNARLANFDRAGELLAVASQSSDLTDQVAKLREQIAQVRAQRPVPR